jgi:hypothetical protein
MYENMNFILELLDNLFHFAYSHCHLIYFLTLKKQRNEFFIRAIITNI